MIPSLLISALSCVGVIALVLLKPTVEWKTHKIGVYWLPAFAGGILLVISRLLSVEETWHGLSASGEMNPLKILALFLSLTFLSVYLDELGFFRRIAFSMLRHARGSQKKLFVFTYLLVSILTVFTSNDIVVLTFTPFICCFCKEENVDPLPYLIGEFVAANTWSMALVIGNPTNIYLSAVCGIGFWEYFAVMWLPTLLAGTIALAALFIVFGKQLSKPLQPLNKTAEPTDKNLLVIGVAHLLGCIVCLAVSAYLPMSMWLISVCFAGSLAVFTLVYSLNKKRRLTTGKLIGDSMRREPWELIPFVISMFVLVLSLQKYGVTGELAKLLDVGGKGEIITYGVASFLGSNIINNIPMSVLFAGVIESSAAVTQGKIYATIIGSNLGAYLTPIGALAGIMWSGLLKTHNVKFSFKDFTKYGALFAVPAMLAALLGLWIVL